LFDRLQNSGEPFAHAKSSIQVAWPDGVDREMYRVSDFWVSQPSRLSLLLSPTSNFLSVREKDQTRDLTPEKGPTDSIIVHYELGPRPLGDIVQ
jgi:hypothetical protein